jgi:hypothetical protein
MTKEKLSNCGWDIVHDDNFNMITFEKSDTGFLFLVSFDMEDGQIIARGMYDEPIFVNLEEMKLMIQYYESWKRGEFND